MQQPQPTLAAFADGVAIIAMAFISGAVVACAILSAFGGFTQ